MNPLVSLNTAPLPASGYSLPGSSGNGPPGPFADLLAGAVGASGPPDSEATVPGLPVPALTLLALSGRAAPGPPLVPPAGPNGAATGSQDEAAVGMLLPPGLQVLPLPVSVPVQSVAVPTAEQAGSGAEGPSQTLAPTTPGPIALMPGIQGTGTPHLPRGGTAAPTFEAIIAAVQAQAADSPAAKAPEGAGSPAFAAAHAGGAQTDRSLPPPEQGTAQSPLRQEPGSARSGAADHSAIVPAPDTDSGQAEPAAQTGGSDPSPARADSPVPPEDPVQPPAGSTLADVARTSGQDHSDHLIQPAAARPDAPAGPAGERPAVETQTRPRAAPEPEPVLRQVTHFVKVAVEGRRSEVHLHLHPQELGTMTVRLVVAEGGVQAHLSVQDGAVRTMLEANMDHLKGRLADQGLKLEQVHISAGGEPPAGHPGGRQPRQQPGEQRPPGYGTPWQRQGEETGPMYLPAARSRGAWAPGRVGARMDHLA